MRNILSFRAQHNYLPATGHVNATGHQVPGVFPESSSDLRVECDPLMPWQSSSVILKNSYSHMFPLHYYSHLGLILFVLIKIHLSVGNLLVLSIFDSVICLVQKHFQLFVLNTDLVSMSFMSVLSNFKYQALSSACFYFFSA